MATSNRIPTLAAVASLLSPHTHEELMKNSALHLTILHRAILSPFTQLITQRESHSFLSRHSIAGYERQ